MSLYVAPTLRLTMSYPGGFLPRSPEMLEEVLQREHMSAAEGTPVACLHTIFEATRGAVSHDTSLDEVAPETILLVAVDRSCLAGGWSEDHGLAMIAGLLLRMPSMTTLVAPEVQHVGGHHGHRIHAGMSTGMMIVDGAAGSDGTFGRQAPVYVVAASFEQQKQWLLACYLSGTRGEQGKMIGRMSVSFDGAEQVRLFPFLKERGE